MSIRRVVSTSVAAIALAASIVSVGVTSASAATMSELGPFSTYAQCNAVRQAYKADYAIVNACFQSGSGYWFRYGPTS